METPKVMTITKVKKHPGVVGKEYQHEGIVIREKAELHFWMDEIYGDMDGEQVDHNEDALNAIHRLQNGFHSVDQGDFYVDVEIMDYNDYYEE